MTITPEKLRELSFAEAPHNEVVSLALLQAADEIERLNELANDTVTRKYALEMVFSDVKP